MTLLKRGLIMFNRNSNEMCKPPISENKKFLLDAMSKGITQALFAYALRKMEKQDTQDMCKIPSINGLKK